VEGLCFIIVPGIVHGKAVCELKRLLGLAFLKKNVRTWKAFRFPLLHIIIF